ncbi:hypothetical protein ACQW08_00990 [Gluconobacter japonicus]
MDGDSGPNSVYRGSPDNVGFRATAITTLMSTLKAKAACLLVTR